jgi:hypothetical protein
MTLREYLDGKHFLDDWFILGASDEEEPTED